jgi:hypothetical protein
MNGDSFCSCLEWNRVSEQVAELAAAGNLDEQQAGLTRLLRYPHNWRLREITLRSLRELKAPTDELLAEVLRLAADEEVYLELRLLAVGALSTLLAKRESKDGDGRHAARRRVDEKIGALADSPAPPVLRKAIQECLTAQGAAAS